MDDRADGNVVVLVKMMEVMLMMMKVKMRVLMKMMKVMVMIVVLMIVVKMKIVMMLMLRGGASATNLLSPPHAATSNWLLAGCLGSLGSRINLS